MANTYNICTKLQSIADALGDAQTSDLIDALADIAQAISQGGGGGTSDYTQLTNKPQINGYVLSGNQTSSQLGLQSALTFDNTPTSGSSNPVTSDGVYDAIDTLNSNIDSTPEDITNGGKSVSGTAVQLFPVASVTKKYISVAIARGTAINLFEVNSYFILNSVTTAIGIRLPIYLNSDYRGYLQLIKDGSNYVTGSVYLENGAQTFTVTVYQHN